jgi:hypothetical protein
MIATDAPNVVPVEEEQIEPEEETKKSRIDFEKIEFGNESCF